MLAAGYTPSAMSCIKRLIVSIMIRNEISGVGESSGDTWANAEDVFIIRPVAIHIGMTSAMFVETCETAVNVHGIGLMGYI